MVMPNLGVDGVQFTLDGQPANSGHRLRGASLSGIVLGIDIGPAYGVEEIDTLAGRAVRAGLNAITLALPPPTDDHRDRSRSFLDVTTAVVERGLVPFIRVVASGDAWRRVRAGVRPTLPDHSGLASYVSAATHRLASVMPHTFAVVIDLPAGPLSHGETTRALINAARDAANGRGLVGARVLPDGDDDDAVMPDFQYAPRFRRGPDATHRRQDCVVPTVRGDDGSDLDDPVGELGQAVSDGASWFLGVGYRTHRHTRTRDPLEAFLETVRAARAGGHAPSDHPTVALADLRHTFRRHADAIRGLNLAPANAPGSGPR